MTFTDKVKKEIKDSKHPLAEAFYKYGHISDPENKHYELSITPADTRIFEIELIKYDINMKQSGKAYYIKNFDDIIKFLTVIGAENSVFQYLDTKVMKEIRANSNREVNFETSNIKRQAEATKKQLDIISKLDIDELSDKYKRIVKTRLKYQYATMGQLSEMLGYPKSGINYAFRKMAKQRRK